MQPQLIEAVRPLFSPAEDDDDASIPTGIARFCSSSGQADAVLLARLYAGIDDECGPLTRSPLHTHAHTCAESAVRVHDSRAPELLHEGCIVITIL